MWKNEHGNSLLTVMLMSLIFMTLGLGIVASSISGAKKVETRESDIYITHDSIKLVEKIITDITLELSNHNLKGYRNKVGKEITVKESYDKDLEYMLQEFLSINSSTLDSIECINIIDISTIEPNAIDDTVNPCSANLVEQFTYDIDTTKDFTRVLEFVLVTKNSNPGEGNISRTIRKRVILSPLPSFLKYAVGSYAQDLDNGLFLNGSANIVGNVYANQLSIDENATYQLRDGTEKKQNTPSSSINGDMYSSSAKLIPFLDPKYYYMQKKENVPNLLNDSQFINLDFEETFMERINEILVDSGLSTLMVGEGTTLTADLNNEFVNKWSLSSCPVFEEEAVNTKVELNKALTQDIPINNSCIIDSSDYTKIAGDVVIMSDRAPISFAEGNDIVIDGDLYMVGNNDISVDSNIFVTGDLHIINFDGLVNFKKNIIALKSITIESYVDNHNNSSNGVVFSGDIFAGKALNIKPHSSKINMNKNLITTLEDFTVLGDEINKNNEIEEKEDDEVVFDSVVYTARNAFISNVNILSGNTDAVFMEDSSKPLVLLAKKDLVITRVNEFNNFDPINEEGKPYLPLESNIKPLEGFFYTESSAELYGVGSLFYIKGGIFAKERLEINAVRGKVENINNLPGKLSQEGEFSRFIVEYNQSVLLQRIDALPIVEHLQLISDELTVE